MCYKVFINMLSRNLRAVGIIERYAGGATRKYLNILKYAGGNL